MSEDVMERLSKLLRLAAGTANIPEGNAAAVKAAELMRKHKIDPDKLWRVEEVEKVVVIVERGTPTPRKPSRGAEAVGRLIGSLLLRLRLHY